MVFFSQDLLNINSKKNSPLAIVWLASTLGSKTSFKKLSKKDINSVKIPYVCKYLSDDRDDFALRLSSNLLVGVSRVYKLQTDQLLLDANHVLINFKRALFSLQQAPLDQQITEARPEAITLPIENLDRIIGFNDEAVFKVPPSRAEMAAARNDSEDLTSLSLSLAAPGSAKDRTMMSGSGGHLSQHSSFGLAPPVFPSSSIPGASAKSSFTSSKDGVDVKSVLEISDPLLRVPKTSRPPSGSGLGGSEDDFLMGGDDLLLFPDDQFGNFNDDYGPLVFNFPVHEPAPPLKSDADILGSDPNMMDLDADLAPASSEKEAFDISQEKTPKKTPKSRRAPPKKRKFVLVDESISLTDTQLHQMRTNADLLLKDNERTIARDEQRKKQEAMIKRIPDLWMARFPASMHTVMKKLRETAHKKRFRFDFNPRVAGEPEYEADEEEYGEEQGRGGAAKRAKRLAEDQFVDDYYGQDDYGVGALEGRMSAEPQDLSLEVGRAASGLAEMPWHAPRSETGTASSARGSKRATPIRRGRADESPLPFDFDTPQQGPSSTSNDAIGFNDIGAFDESSFEKIVREGSERTNGGEITDAETKAFYEYVKMLAIETQSTSVFLLDICLDQPRKTAAAAFYNVLRCAHEGIVEVTQIEGDVEIVIFASA